MLTEAISINRKYEDKMIKMREKYDSVELKIESLRGVLRKLRKECLNNDEIVSNMKDDFNIMKNLANRLLADISKMKQEIQLLKVDITDKEEDITNRDSCIKQLEILLESITHKYAENEKRRNKITHEVATQAKATVANASSSADFLPTPLGGVAARETENKRPGRGDALLPGRIFKLADKNWPSIKSGLQYRRAIDKL